VVKGSRATRARRNSEALWKAGFEAPTNIAWGTLPGGREYLFTHAVPGAGVTQWLRFDLCTRDPASLALRRQLLRELGVFIGRLHATGFIHGDLRPSNVLAAKGMERFQFSLIDNERNIQQTPPPGKLVLKNLMQLNMLLPTDLTRTDRMRFFSAWHSQMRDLTEVEARLLAIEAYRWACRRLRAKGKI
jgi:tRNA A-37 threonylcarbamoyl transferase component Bud32